MNERTFEALELKALIELAQKNALKIAAGHSFIIFMQDIFP